MYTVQALWTVAREALNVTTLICSNKSYNILKMGLSRLGITSISPKLSSLVDLDRPDINWVKIAEGMGVPAVSVNSVDGLADEVSQGTFRTRSAPDRDDNIPIHSLEECPFTIISSECRAVEA
jgi:acetolactate synthase-1/2/3 large subunit